MLTVDELHGLLEAMESDRVERQASISDMRKIRRAVCAIANDLPAHDAPGVVLVGVHDDGSCAGVEITDDLLKLLAQIRGNGDILPVPSMTVEKKELNGCEVAVIEVQPASAPPVRFRGRIWVRVGPTTQEAGADDERVLREKAQSQSLPFDRRGAEGATVVHLDLPYFESEYLPHAVWASVLARNQRSVEERLASLRLLTGTTPSHGALVLMGHHPRDFVPGAFVQFLRIDGLELGDPIKDEKQLDGPLHQVVSQLDDLMEINISVAVDFTSAATENRVPDYPLPALQQLVRNALIHRNYETSNAPVRIYWFNDRIEIHNPGGLYGQVTPETFGEGATDYRNPLVAEIMATLGYVQRFGFGIPTARRQLEANGNPPPEFTFQQRAFLAIVRRRP